jgi:hypothetical protein
MLKAVPRRQLGLGDPVIASLLFDPQSRKSVASGSK